MPIPTPEPGLVISYSYLWHHEHEGGREEGRKDRPSVIVLTVEHAAHDSRRGPAHHPFRSRRARKRRRNSRRGETASRARPRAVMDRWPGYDTRTIGRGDRYDYGLLPPRFFRQVVAAFAAWHRTRKAELTSRE
jgi:hypothetical protein